MSQTDSSKENVPRESGKVWLWKAVLIYRNFSIYKGRKVVFLSRPTRVKKIKTHRWSLGGGFS